MGIIITAVIAGAAGMAAGYSYRGTKNHQKLDRNAGEAKRSIKRMQAGQFKEIKNNDWMRENGYAK